MIDIVTVGAGGGSIAWVSPEGTLKVGPRSAGADPGPLCYGRGGTEPTVTDAHVLLGRIPPHLLGGEIPLDVEAARAGLAGARPTGSGSTWSGLRRRHPRDLRLEPGQRAPPGHRQARPRRARLPMVAFGGSGPLLLCRLIDILGLPAVLVPRDPGNVSRVRAAHRRRAQRLRADRRRRHDRPRPRRGGRRCSTSWRRRPRAALDREGFARRRTATLRTADLRYFGQAFEVRVPAPDGPVDEAFGDAVADALPRRARALYGYGYRDDPRQPVEWVNLRVTGVGPIARPGAARAARRRRRTATARAPGTRRCTSTTGPTTPVYWRRATSRRAT